jgi:predicted Zn-dependent protease
VTFDAQVELGRYREAAATAQAMIDRKPGLASFARVSYLRELTGDQRGAVLAMEQAVASGAGSAADVAYVQTLVGDLRLGLGVLPAAETAYRRALAVSPGYGPAEVGLGQLAIARGDLAGAARLLDPVARRLPLPGTVALLGDVHARLGQPRSAEEQYRLVRAIEALNRANGVTVDLELVE